VLDHLQRIEDGHASPIAQGREVVSGNPHRPATAPRGSQLRTNDRPAHSIEREAEDRPFSRDTGIPVEIERPREVFLAVVTPIEWGRGTWLGAGPVVVVAHHEDPVGAGRRSGERHRGSSDVGLCRHRYLGVDVDGTNRGPQASDELAVRPDMRHGKQLDVDVDPVDAQIAGQGDQLGDRPILGLGRGEEGGILASAERRVDELDADAPFVRTGD
jgi:hypothetical protein